MKDLARHLLLELYDCDAGILDDAETLQHLMVQAAARLRATILDVFCHRFSPQGVTVAVIIAESHLTVHTWPEYGYAAVDIFTCGPRTNPSAAVPALREFFQPERIETMEMTRGILLEEPVGAHARD